MAKNIQYPLISEYVDAIRSAEDNFDKLSDLRPVLDNSGNPVMSSGNFAVVFKMKDVNTGKLYAVKCFTKEQEGREEAYRQIADELEFVQSTYFAKVKYYDRELFVDTQSSDDSEFPVLLMDWVEGETLDRYIRQNINDTYALEMLAYNFSRLAMWLLPQPFAHGDLKPDNILVHDDGSLTLVDYDGMFVPVMQGQKSRELGSPDFRHPLRTESDFNEHIDDFPAISIILSLRLIAADPSLLDEYGAADRLLFSESDYRDLSSCELLKSVFPSQNAEINTLVSLFTIACTHKTLANVSFRLFSVTKPNKPETIEVKEELSTKVTKEDLKNSVADQKYDGAWVRYTKNYEKLLQSFLIIKKEYDEYSWEEGPKSYEIRENTKIICDNAFEDSFLLENINFPSTIISIGSNAFSDCSALKDFTLPPTVIAIGDYAFSGCSSLQKMTIPSSMRKIGSNPFIGCDIKIINKSLNFVVIDNIIYNKDKTVLISYCSKQTFFQIPTSVKYIGKGAFASCDSIREVIIPSSVKVIEDFAFKYCSFLQTVSINSGLTVIGKEAFSDCDSLQEISIPSSVTTIGDRAFYCCSSLENISIPSNLTVIGDSTFDGCSSLKEITIPSSVTTIGDHAFDGCSSLKEITIPSNVTTIGDHAFDDCSSLKEIVLPEKLKKIGINPFSFCKCKISSKSPYFMTKDNVLYNADMSVIISYLCEQKTFSIPSSVKTINDSAFLQPDTFPLKELFIPSSVISIGSSFNDYNLTLERLIIKTPKNNRIKLMKMLPRYELYKEDENVSYLIQRPPF